MKGMQGEEDGLEYEHETTNSNFTTSNPEITNTTPIFPNFQDHPSFLSPPPHLLFPSQPKLQHPQFSQNTPAFNVPTTTNSSEDGGKTVKTRRMGRPPGAKNKPKPPIMISPKPESKPAMSPYIIELPSGSDLVDSLTRFTRQHGIGICVLAATGAVLDVTLKQPSGDVSHGTVTFRGRFDLISISACVMTDTTPFGVSIAMAGQNGLVVGGRVVGPLVCAGTVYVIATSFNSPSFVRIPLENKNQSASVTDGNGNGNGNGNGDRSGFPVSESGGTHKSLHGDSDEVLCAPTPLTVRPPQPPY